MWEERKTEKEKVTNRKREAKRKERVKDIERETQRRTEAHTGGRQGHCTSHRQRLGDGLEDPRQGFPALHEAADHR